MIGMKLRKIREENGLSLAELSEKSGIGLSELEDIESGKASCVMSKTLLRIAAAIGTDISNLAEVRA